MKSFYNSWKNKTRQEERAIKSLKKALHILLTELPKKDIIAVYAKGSFVRREMNKKSDVDTLTIVKSSNALNKLRELERKYREKFRPQIQLVGYSIWELKHNKRIKTKDNKPRASPSRAVQHLEHYKLIYGKPLKKEELASGTNLGHLKGMVGAFNNIFIPGYEHGKMGFSEIAKQVFWLVENEQKVKGNNPPHSFKELAKSIKDKNHIIHNALKYRKRKPKDKRIRKAFMNKLKKYIKEVEKELK